MNRTETTEEKEWREASHPRLVKRLEDQRTALADLNRHVQSLTAEIATLTAERDTLAAKCEQLQAIVNNYAELWTFLDAVARFKAAERHGEWMAAIASQSAQTPANKPPFTGGDAGRAYDAWEAAQSKAEGGQQ